MANSNSNRQTLHLKTVTISLILVASGAAFYFARYVVLTAIIGIGLGVLFVPAISFMNQKLHIPRSLGGLVLALGIIGVFSGIGLSLGWLISSQAAEFRESFPSIYQSLENRFNTWSSQVPWLTNQLQGANPQNLIKNIGHWALGGIQSSMTAIAGTFITLVIAIYTAVNSNRYFSGVLTAFPHRLRTQASDVLESAGKALRAWAKAQLLDMAAVGIAVALGLWIIGIDYWIVLGLLAGLLDIVPYLGPITAAMLTILVALGSEPDKIPWIIGLFFLVQQLEGNILIPLIMREEAELPEVPLLILIILMSTWFGLIGALLAAPLLAVGRTIYLMTYKAKMDREIEVSASSSSSSKKHVA